jgi:hypothetical protein
MLIVSGLIDCTRHNRRIRIVSHGNIGKNRVQPLFKVHEFISGTVFFLLQEAKMRSAMLMDSSRGLYILKPARF